MTPGLFELRRQSSDGTGATEVLLRQTGQIKLLDYSPDGRFLVYQSSDVRSKPDAPATANGGNDLWVLPLVGEDKKPRQITSTPAILETTARVSPDGRWIAFSSDEGGKANIWVQAFPDGAGRFQVSADGGMDPGWGAGGRELYYVALDGSLMLVPVTAGASSGFGTPTRLFKFAVGPIGVPFHLYSASPDGKRFLVSEMSDSPVSITIVLHWTSLLR